MEPEEDWMMGRNGGVKAGCHEKVLELKAWK